jgi:hypothetical protein
MAAICAHVNAKITGPQNSAFKGLRFASFPSRRHLSLADAVAYATSLGATLPSLAEELAIQELSRNTIENPYQSFHTRTIGVSYLDDYRPHIAVADPLGEANLFIARAAEAQTAPDAYGRWSLPLDDEHVQHVIADAKREGRVLRYPESSWYTAQKSDFASDPVARALYGDAVNLLESAASGFFDYQYAYFHLPTEHMFEKGKAFIHRATSGMPYQLLRGCKQLALSGPLRPVIPVQSTPTYRNAS